MVNASDVSALNSRIEKLNKARTKAEAQREFLTESLEKELNEYKTKYGKSLKGKSFEDTVNAIKVELKKVSERVEKEYELKNKIVEALENGEYDIAYELLGVKKEQSAVQEGTQDTVKSGGSSEDEYLFDDTEDLEELLNELENDGSSEDESDSPSDTPMSEEKPKSAGKEALKTGLGRIVKSPIKTPVKENMEYDVNSFKPKDTPVFGTGQPKLNIGDIDLGDDDEDSSLPDLSGTDFGFGDALKGSQFSV